MRARHRPGSGDDQRQHLERQRAGAGGREPQLPGQAQHDQREQAAPRRSPRSSARARLGAAGRSQRTCWHHSQHGWPHRPVAAGHLAGPAWRAAADAAHLALVRHRAHAAPALPRRPPGPHRQQPDLHHADRAGAAGHGDAGAVLGLPDVRQVPGRAAAVLPAKPGARRHRQAGAGRADAVCGQGQPAGQRSGWWCCWSRRWR